MENVEDPSTFIIETPDSAAPTPRPFPDGWQDVVFRVDDAGEEGTPWEEDQSFFSLSRTAAEAP